MITTYILVLLLSAWLLSYGLVWTHRRMTRIFQKPLAMPAGSIALAVVLGMFLVVGAPAWLCLLAFGVLVMVNVASVRSVPLALLAVAVLLLLLPFLGMSTGFALDAALIGAAVLGETHAS
jgi:hypothetical protein